MTGKTYTIDFTDPSKSTIDLTPRLLIGPSGTTRRTDLDLLGIGHSLWGDLILQNMIHLLENFACGEDLHTIVSIDTTGGAGSNSITISGNVINSFPADNVFDITGSDTNDGVWTTISSLASYDSLNNQTTIVVVEALNASVTLGEVGHIGWPNKSITYSPITPTEGQVWYNQTRGQIFTYVTDATGSPITSYWRRVGGVNISTTQPTSPAEGDLWWDTTTYTISSNEYGRSLLIYTGGLWVRVVDNYLPRDGSKTMQGTLDMGTNTIINLVDPTNPQDSVTKNYADTTFVNVTGDTMSGILNMGANKIENLADPIAIGDAVNLGYADNRYVNVTGDTMTGLLTLSGDPTSALHAATKQYVDTTLTTSTGFIQNYMFPVPQSGTFFQWSKNTNTFSTLSRDVYITIDTWVMDGVAGDVTIGFTHWASRCGYLDSYVRILYNGGLVGEWRADCTPIARAINLTVASTATINIQVRTRDNTIPVYTNNRYLSTGNNRMVSPAIRTYTA